MVCRKECDCVKETWNDGVAVDEEKVLILRKSSSFIYIHLGLQTPQISLCHVLESFTRNGRGASPIGGCHQSKWLF